MKRVLRNGIAVAVIWLTGVLYAEMPSWWIERGVVDTNAAPNDCAPVNQGQAKYVAYQAYLEFGQKLGSASSAISNLVAGFSMTNNYLPANLGQLKYLATPFYDQLNAPGLTNARPAGMTVGPYPWSGSTNTPNDFAIANIGQLKYLFSFYFEGAARGTDTDSDGLPDWLEELNGWAANSLDTDGDGYSDYDELCVYHTNPSNNDVLPPSVSIVTPVSRIIFVP